MEMTDNIYLVSIYSCIYIFIYIFCMYVYMYIFSHFSTMLGNSLGFLLRKGFNAEIDKEFRVSLYLSHFTQHNSLRN